MKIFTFLTTCLATAVITIPAAGSTGSQTHNLVQKISFKAQSTEATAGLLQSYSSDRLDWQAQGEKLMTLRDEINHLGRDVYRLQTENALPVGERRLVDRVAMQVNLMGNDAEDAILYGRSHRDILWRPAYERDVSRLYSHAESLVRDTNAVRYFERSGETS